MHIENNHENIFQKLKYENDYCTFAQLPTQLRLRASGKEALREMQATASVPPIELSLLCTLQVMLAKLFIGTASDFPFSTFERCAGALRSQHGEISLLVHCTT